VRTEDYASILLAFANGARGNLAVSQVAAGRKNCLRLEVYGSRKSAWWNSEQPEALGFGHRDCANEVALRNTPGFAEDVARYTDYPPGHCEGFPDTFKMLFRCVYERIALGGRGAPLFATAADGRAHLEVCEAILKSHRARAWMRV